MVPLLILTYAYVIYDQMDFLDMQKCITVKFKFCTISKVPSQLSNTLETEASYPKKPEQLKPKKTLLNIAILSPMATVYSRFGIKCIT